MNLYKVTIEESSSNHFYVLATDPTKAYNEVREYLDKTDLFFPDNREMKSIELIADDKDFGSLRKRPRLFL